MNAAMRVDGITRLSISISDTEPPSEFRLFVAGWNDTEHGPYLFDAPAAQAVMAAYNKHDVDRMIDLEHLSLDPESASFDPDARGWCKLELRDDGSLWAVGVQWTADGAARLSDKRQRYISPTFGVDSKTKRVTKIVNIALTALPATHGTPALVAATQRLGAGTSVGCLPPIDQRTRVAANVADSADYWAEESAKAERAFLASPQRSIMNTTRKLSVDPAEAEKKLAAIAKVLGVESPTDFEAIRQGVEQLLAPSAEAARLALRRMDAREVAMCREKKLSPARYVATRDAIRARRVGGVKR